MAKRRMFAKIKNGKLVCSIKTDKQIADCMRKIRQIRELKKVDL